MKRELSDFVREFAAVEKELNNIVSFLEIMEEHYEIMV